MDSKTVVVLDNGAQTAKIGLATQDDPMFMPNCIMKAKAERRRVFIGNQISECRDCSGLYFLLCFQKGYLLNWDTQKTVWDHMFSTDGAGFTLEDRNIIVTEPQLNFTSLREAMSEILFEEFNCNGMVRTTTADLAAFNYATECEEIPISSLHCIVIDVGFSFTHIVPFISGKAVEKGIRRIEIGGKLLTNHMKEIISYRHLNLMEETFVVNQIKEDVCFVSQDFKDDMLKHKTDVGRKELSVDYVLPDFTTVKRGFIRDMNEASSSRTAKLYEQHQSLRLCNERFTVPELLFHPLDIGIDQLGIPGAVVDALKDCPEMAHSELLRNILVIGGSSLFPGFVPRLKKEIRALAVHDLEVSLIFPEDPIGYGWYGGKELANSNTFESMIFTRQDYEEYGTPSNKA